MTDPDIARLGPAFASFLRRFRPCFRQDRTAAHFDSYCRGLLSDLPRKSVEPIALACGTAVRTLQEFLTTAGWDHEQARDALQRHLAEVIRALPADALGTVGVIDETSCSKQGDKTPGVQRQYRGCLGKVDNGIVSVHVGVARGRFQALLDADLYLPKSWDQDRPRCREAGIPDEVRYQPQWRVALDQLIRLHQNGVRFDWLTFDEGYGGKVPFLTLLSLVGQTFVAEVPVSFAVRSNDAGPPRRADQALTAEDAKRGRCYRISPQTRADARWRARGAPVRVKGHGYTLVVAVNEATAELKYFVTTATGESLQRVLQVAFRRATIEHSFRVAKAEAGLAHYEGRQYVGLVRHLVLALIVLGFVSVHTDRLRGEKPAGDAGAGVPGAERPLRGAVPPPSGDAGGQPRRRGDPLPPAPQRAGGPLPQETAA
ncbi:MAG: IS701 family transposase [Specibacter sp.]